MNHKVHHITGVVIAQSALLYHGVPALSFHTAGVVVCGYLAAMAPDFDKPGSYLTAHQPFRALSETMDRIGIPHRGPLHSAPMLFLLFLLFKFAVPLPPVYLWTIILAYASHIFLDMFNSAGVMLLYPWKFDFRLLPSFMAVSSDDRSIVQTLLYALFSVVFYMLLINMILEILSHTPIVGTKIEEIRGWVVNATSGLWGPIAHAIDKAVSFLKQISELPNRIFGR